MIVLTAGKAILRGVYALHKAMPVRRDRVAIISRQGNAPSEDILLLKKALLEEEPQLDVRVLCRTLDGGLVRKAGYLLHMIGPQMHTIATSRAVVLDSYCIAVSILHHRPALKVVQMWHAMGAFKKFGKSILGQKEGTGAALASQMHMHENYDLLIASSETCVPYFAEAFGYPPEAFRILPLPRADLLQDSGFMKDKAEEIRRAVPALQSKKVILFAPTFRKGSEPVSVASLAAEVGKDPDYVLVLAPHPNMSDTDVPEGVICDRKYSTLEWLSVCDAFVTDYSAVTFDAAVAGKPMYFFAPDKAAYLDARGFYLDYEKDLPSEPKETAEEIMAAIRNEACTAEDVQKFRRKYVAEKTDCAAALARLVLSRD